MCVVKGCVCEWGDILHIFSPSLLVYLQLIIIIVPFKSRSIGHLDFFLL